MNPEPLDAEHPSSSSARQLRLAPPTAGWRPVAGLPEGAAVLQISAGTAGRLWLATTHGLYIRQVDGWLGLEVDGQALGTVNSVLALGKLVLAAGPPHGLARSLTDGHDWQPCLVEQAHRPINCLAASPRFNQDNVLLAGTDGDGILRSIDGGRSWALSNFGLRDFSILCLATGGAWERKEPAFAGTVSGVYASPNGGRAWRFSGLDGQAVQALAVAPHIDAGPLTVYAGLEAGGLQISRDGGSSWEAAGLPGNAELAVNAVLCPQRRPQAGSVLAAATGGRGSFASLWRSTDAGKSWKAIPGAPADIFCLAEAEDVIYAGGAESGLWTHAPGHERP